MILVLFDVDGTLTRGRGAGARALERALEERYGWRRACAGIRFHGGTDIGIVRAVLARGGVLADDPDESRAQVEQILARYVEILPAEVDRTPYSALPGALALLKALAVEDIRMGLVTGNHPFGAEQKLRSAGLWGHFACGAYGSESEDRGALVTMAIRRATGGEPERARRVYVVGDTENDVRAAKRASARAIAVTTGGATRETLAVEAPDAIFGDLEEAHRAAFWRDTLFDRE